MWVCAAVVAVCLYFVELGKGVRREAVGAVCGVCSIAAVNSSLSALIHCRQPILRCTDVSTTLVLGSCLSGFLDQLFLCLCL